MNSLDYEILKSRIKRMDGEVAYRWDTNIPLARYWIEKLMKEEQTLLCVYEGAFNPYGFIADLNDVINSLGLSSLITFNHARLVLTFLNGSKVLFREFERERFIGIRCNHIIFDSTRNEVKTYEDLNEN